MSQLHCVVVRNNLTKCRSQTSDNMDSWKAEQRSQVRRKKIQVPESQKKNRIPWTVRKVATRFVFSLVCGSGGSKSKLAEVAGAKPCRQRRNEKLHAAVARSTFSCENGKKMEARMSKNGTPFWRQARFQVNVQNTPSSDQVLKFRCRKIACRCGTKQIYKSKCTRHLRFGPLWGFDVAKLSDKRDT